MAILLTAFVGRARYCFLEVHAVALSICSLRKSLEESVWARLDEELVCGQELLEELSVST